MVYYNAIVHTDYNTSIKYKNIRFPEKFIANVSQVTSAKVIFFYRKDGRKTKNGDYCGKWFPRKGLIKYSNW